MNENSLIRDIGRSYIVSSILPAAIFVALVASFYQDFILSYFVNGEEIDNIATGLIVFLLSASIMWIGFALYSSINWTVRLYEGYYLHPLIKKLLVTIFFRRRHRNKIKYINKVLQANKHMSPDSKNVINKYYDQAWADYGDVELSSPLREEDLLPSMLGNVLRASEQYPAKYGLTAGVNMWTRLSVLLPPEMASILEEKNNNILFLLNSSLLAYLHSLLALVIGVVNYNTQANGFIVRQIWIAVTCFVAGYILYLLSVPVAKTLGLLIRSSFDLYRFDLLKQLNYSVPSSLSQEQALWLKISDFIVTAGSLGKIPLEFEYDLQRKYLSENLPTRKSSKKPIRKKIN